MQKMSKRILDCLLILTLQGLQLALSMGTTDEVNTCGGFCTAPGTGTIEAMIDDLTAALHAAKCELADTTQWPHDPSLAALSLDELQDLSYDYVVVGAGTAGSIVASRLSEQLSTTVLLLEAGDYPPVESEVYRLSNELQHNAQYAWHDYAVPNAGCCRAMKTGRCYYPRGKMLGGTGALNDNIFLPSSAAKFNRWLELGNTGWGWTDIQKLMEQMQLPLNYFEPLPVQQQLASLVLNATEELGIGPAPAHLHTSGIGFGYTQRIPATIAAGRRVSTARAYLAAAEVRSRSNLHVMRQAMATKVLLDKQQRAVGVAYTLRDNTQLRVWARREVIVAAGAINSPKLLLLSGIGPKLHLRSMGVPNRVELPVGENLQDHGMMPILLKFRNSSHTNNMTWDYAAQANHETIVDYLLKRQGPLAAGFTLMGFINSTHPNDTTAGTQPDLHLISHTFVPRYSSGSFGFLGFRDDLVEALKRALQSQSMLQIMGSLLQPQSRGRVRLRSTIPNAPPIINNNYGIHPEDQAVLLRYVRFVQQLTRTKAFQAQGLQLLRLPLAECDRSATYDTDDYWLCFIRHFYVSSWHFAGTCRMGRLEDPRTVVDDRLRVKHVAALRVIDASIMPEISSGNTNGPTVLIAEKGARMILEDQTNNTV